MFLPIGALGQITPYPIWTPPSPFGRWLLGQGKGARGGTQPQTSDFHLLSDRQWGISTVSNTTRVVLCCPVNTNLDELVSAFIQLDLEIVLPQASLKFVTSKAKVGYKEPDFHCQHLWLLVSQEYVYHLLKIIHRDDRLLGYCLELAILLVLLEDAIKCVVCTCKFNVIDNIPLAFIHEVVF